ncbi:thiamine biosynthesis/tRNA modification protein ThiI [Methanocaldococcus vulcanius M7]|uniref:Probable tRNA sulfurtransferase n=1 Tax=Methanocaldococcus vulcanius (strain ATCC 700851 / DSM 12094 / M7) TaxID=579137 RepID=C9RE69_METVM|nr:tRNA uracil 4-sulfurtransferase ThiI [Methanocaldococcus vulcanius]ACX73598.1 thiamine biosynthesis/tRNA modification protein ThiI [Methanocaldococcus vulcanius M7]
MEILVRYGEIGLKSTPIRRNLEEILRKNIIKLFRKYEIDADVIILHRRLLIKLNTKNKEDLAIKLLKKVSGIVSYSPVYECRLDIEEISNTAIQLLRKKIKSLNIGDNAKNITFAVKTKRSYKKFPYTSVEVNEKVGEKVIEKLGLNVDLENPDIIIGIEILKDRAYVFTEKYEGIGGLPAGSQGRALCLISDGIDSPVAAFMMIRRGCRVVLLHLKMSEEALNKVRKIVEILSDYDTDLEFVVYDYKKDMNNLIEKLSQIKKENYTCIFCKKNMLKVAKKYAKYLDCDAIITGDNLGQVASQTLKNLRVISEGVDYLILRPLIGLDKDEIIKIAKNIGTYEISTEKEIKCPYLPKHPKTVAKPEEIKKIEEKIKL